MAGRGNQSLKYCYYTRIHTNLFSAVCLPCTETQASKQVSSCPIETCRSLSKPPRESQNTTTTTRDKRRSHTRQRRERVDYSNSISSLFVTYQSCNSRGKERVRGVQVKKHCKLQVAAIITTDIRNKSQAVRVQPVINSRPIVILLLLRIGLQVRARLASHPSPRSRQRPTPTLREL